MFPLALLRLCQGREKAVPRLAHWTQEDREGETHPGLSALATVLGTPILE